MKIIFHIGMGKTGTTSIQRALKANEDALREQRAEYLGMWFGFIDPKFDDHTGLVPFFRQSGDELRQSAEKLAEILKSQNEKEGTETFIHSCEGIFGNVSSARPFFEELSSRVPTSIVAYFRDPRSWLPSAYTQWGLRHKTTPGSIKPYALLAPNLMKSYQAAETWAEYFADIFVARLYSKDIDIVRDFSDVVGVTIASTGKRSLERSEKAEALLRGLFNNRQIEEARPELFNQTVLNTDRVVPRNISNAIDEIFDFSQTEKIIADNILLFESLRKSTGLDLLSAPEDHDKLIDKTVLKDRLIDYIVEIIMQQSIKIKGIEENIEKLNRTTFG